MSGHAPGLATRVATVVLLAAGGAAALLVAARLVAAALHSGFSPVAHLPLPGAPGVRGVGLLVVAAVLAALVWLVARHGEPVLWLATPEGGVSVPASALERLARHAAEADEEVVRAEAEVRVRRGGLAADVRVFGRPLGDARRLGEEAEARVRQVLADTSGSPDLRVRVRPRVLAVRELARHLP